MFAARYISETQASRDAATQADCGVFGPNTSLVGSPSTTPFCEADSAWFFDTSLSYRWDQTFLLTAGINNVGDEEPPLIDLSAGSNRGNRVTSSGYDQFGRTYFFSLTKAF
jgi:iron complex outermembrane receptor protein